MLLNALILGLASSLHCAGMCGAIALALPGASRPAAAFVWGRTQYNLGRILTYTLLGVLAGTVGYTTRLAGGQQILSVILGVAMLLMWGVSALGWLPADQFGSAWISRLLGKALTAWRNSPLILIGLLNGLLPCGMVYTALMGAAVSDSPADGALFMAVFGLGTLPLMLAISLSSRWMQGVGKANWLRRYALPVSRALMLVFALLLILRGLNLGIPYISPEISKEAVECH